MPVVAPPLSTATATTMPTSLAASMFNGVSGFQSSISGIPILVPGLASRR
jgi:hypothetical protein